jgi:hypothetical protein
MLVASLIYLVKTWLTGALISGVFALGYSVGIRKLSITRVVQYSVSWPYWVGQAAHREIKR